MGAIEAVDGGEGGSRGAVRPSDIGGGDGATKHESLG